MRICISWARAVTLAGTARQMSQAEAILPPPSAEGRLKEIYA